MTIEIFTRESANFQLKRDRGMMINAEDLDFEFNNLINYINLTIISKINNFEKQELIGIADPNFENACIVNVGDGTTKWAKINSNFFIDDSIDLTKFFCKDKLIGILFSHTSQEIHSISNNNDDDILFSQNNLLPIFRKIKTGDIENNSLTNEKIAFNSIKLEHFNNELRKNFENPKVTFEYINNDNPLFESKNFLNSSINKESISQEKEYIIKDSYWKRQTQTTLNTMREQIISSSSIIEEYDGNVEIKYVNLKQFPALMSKFFAPKTFQTRHFDPQYKIPIRALCTVPYTEDPEERQKYIQQGLYSFTSNNIKDESLSAYSIYRMDLSGGVDCDPNKIIEDGAIETRHIITGNTTNGIWFDSMFPKAGILTKEHLDPIIRQKLGI